MRELSMFKNVVLNTLFRDQIMNFSINLVSSNVLGEPDELVDFAAAVSSSFGSLSPCKCIDEIDKIGRGIMEMKAWIADKVKFQRAKQRPEHTDGAGNQRIRSDADTLSP
ncbi:ATP-dependent Lon protease pim1 [Stygiomarasmius scandens]|uniref:ATP-dependent Lon protease pim1 n=1 Tax=Marasmiellus scandens TaxID=2682957 RepID=A0ABR1JIE5_9AGAR